MQDLFCLVFARYEDEGLHRLQVLQPQAPILRLFSEPRATEHRCCLLLHSVEQDHRLEAPPTAVSASAQSVTALPSASSKNEAWDGDTLSSM